MLSSILSRPTKPAMAHAAVCSAVPMTEGAPRIALQTPMAPRAVESPASVEIAPTTYRAPGSAQSSEERILRHRLLFRMLKGFDYDNPKARNAMIAEPVAHWSKCFETDSFVFS